MFKLEQEISLKEWEHQYSAYKIYMDQIIRASGFKFADLNCKAVQTTECSFSCDVISGTINFDLQVLRYFLRINAIIDCKSELTLPLFEATTFICFAQELLNSNISLLSGIAFSLFSDKILPCMNDPSYWENFDYRSALEKTRLQAMFLLGHEVFHLRLSKDPGIRVQYLTETQELILSTDFPSIISREVITQITQNESLLEELACDASSFETVLDIVPSSESISFVQVAESIYAGVLNQFLLLQTKSLAMAAINDLETSTAFIKEQLNYLIIRTQVLNAKVVKVFKMKNFPDDVQLYLEKSALCYKNWAESTIFHLINTFDQFKDDTLNSRVNDRVLFYMKPEARIEQGESVDKIEDIIRRRVLDDWDAFDTINI